jgi:hypothetical protein
MIDDFLVFDVVRHSRRKEKIRLVKMLGSEDVGLYTKHGLIQLDWETLRDAVETLDLAERRELRYKKWFIERFGSKL